MQLTARLALFAATLVALSVSAGPRVAASRGLDLFFVDVEGGAATLMVTPAGESVLVDSGWPGFDGRDAKRIEQAARTAGLSQIDHYVTTHWHTDHYGAIEELAKRIPVRRFWDRGIPETLADDPQGFQRQIAAYRRASGGQSTALSAGDRIPLLPAGLPLQLQVVASRTKVLGETQEIPVSCPRHPAAENPDTSDNMQSLALLLRYGKFDFLNCGDLTWNIEHKLVCPKNRIGKVDLWQVTHHGWQASNNPALVEATQPRVAIVVNGPRKGASPRVMELLKSTRSIDAIYQLHLQVETRPEDNVWPANIANVEENCRGELIRVRVTPDGKSYTVYRGAETPWRSFDVR